MSHHREKAHVVGDEPVVHWVTFERISARCVTEIVTDCGLEPEFLQLHVPEDDVTCEACLTAGGEDAVEAVERLLTDARRLAWTGSWLP